MTKDDFPTAVSPRRTCVGKKKIAVRFEFGRLCFEIKHKSRHHMRETERITVNVRVCMCIDFRQRPFDFGLSELWILQKMNLESSLLFTR